MGLFDQHVHSTHSQDSDAEPADCVRRAIEMGLDGLTFTEHYDTHPEEAGRCVYDDEKYTKTISDLRATFGDSIQIGKGVEVDYQPANMPAIVDFLRGHWFDVVVLGVHYFGGEPVFARRAWQGRDPGRITRQYLQTVVEALTWCERHYRSSERVFDVLAHLDFVKRYSLQFTGSDHVAEHGDLIDEILRGCLRIGMIPEVNTATLRKGCDQPMPSFAVMQRYARLGGKMMFLGSDSHRVEEIGSGLERAAQMLQAAGIEQVAVYWRRLPRAVPIA